MPNLILVGFIVVIVILLFIMLRNTRRDIMAAIDDLRAADAAETAELTVVAQALTDEITRVNALIASLQPGTSEADIAAIAADLQSHVANLQTIATGLASQAA